MATTGDFFMVSKDIYTFLDLEEQVLGRVLIFEGDVQYCLGIFLAKFCKTRWSPRAILRW